MSERIEIRSGEYGVVRVFAVDLAGTALEEFGQPGDIWPLKDALGAERLDAEHLELFEVSAMEGFGLAGYLREGMGVEAGQIDEMRPQLAAIKGAALVIRSRAFCDEAQTLQPRAPLRYIGSFTEPDSNVNFEPLPDESAKGSVPTRAKKPSDAAMSGRVAMVALLVLFILTAVVVWVAS